MAIEEERVRSALPTARPRPCTGRATGSPTSRYGPLDPETKTSPRIAPPMIGMGLLELIPEADIVARADPDDRDGDGIRGVAQKAWSARPWPHHAWPVWLEGDGAHRRRPDGQRIRHGHGPFDAAVARLGRRLHRGAGRCRKAPNGDDEVEGVEVTRTMFDLVVFYARNLAVPGRVNAQDAKVLDGKRLFGEIGCAACHVPSHVTGADPNSRTCRGQTIWPYTDLLLHDMGDGLADGFPEGAGSGSALAHAAALGPWPDQDRQRPHAAPA